MKKPADVLEKIFFAIGDDSHAIQKAVTEVTHAFLGNEGVQPMAVEKYFIGEKESQDEQAQVLSRIIESLNTTPIFTQKKVIQLEGFAPSQGENGGKRKGLDELFSSLCEQAQRMSPAILLIVRIENSWDPKALGFETANDDICIQRYFQKDAKKPLKTRVLEKIAKAGKRIQEKDLDEWMRCSESEEGVWKTLDQVLLGLGNNIEISRLQIEPFLEFERDTNAFALSNALSKRDLPKALSLVNQALDHDDEAPQMVLARILNFYSQLQIFSSILKRVPFEKRRFTKDRNGIYNFPDAFVTRLQSEARQGLEKEQMSKHPYALKAMFSAALEYDVMDFGKCLENLQEVDERIKTTSLEPKYLLEEILILMINSTTLLQGIRK